MFHSLKKDGEWEEVHIQWVCMKEYEIWIFLSPPQNFSSARDQRFSMKSVIIYAKTDQQEKATMCFACSWPKFYPCSVTM